MGRPLLWTAGRAITAALAGSGQHNPQPEVTKVHPFLKPALLRLWRDHKTIQLGLDPRHAVVLDGITDAAGSVLDLLDGRLEWSQVVDAAASRGCDPEDSAALLDLLHSCGVLDDAAAAPATIPVQQLDRLAPDHAHASLVAPDPGAASSLLVGRQSAQVVIVGAGRVGASVAALLCATGVGEVVVWDPAISRACDASPAGFGVPRDRRTRAAATVVAAGRAGGGRVVASRLGVDDPQLYAGADLVVLAPDVYVGPAPGLRAALTASGPPYLLVGVRETRGIVGPMVIPGVTSCARCHDLLRADRDPAWPAIAAQLVSGRSGPGVPCDVVLATAVAALAAGQVQDRLDGRPVAALGATLELPLPEWRLLRRPWQPHPDCGCTTAAAS